LAAASRLTIVPPLITAGADARQALSDSTKRIHQRHLEAGITDVVAAGRVMRQSLFAGAALVVPVMAPARGAAQVIKWL
jgi:hypothetical protein